MADRSHGIWNQQHLAATSVVAGCTAAIALCAGLLGERFLAAARSLEDALGATLAWFYPAAVAVFLGFMLWLGLGRYRRVRLGDDDERPEFRTFAWLSMLFAAGTGVGLLFWSVAEPVSLLGDNPLSRDDAATRREAMAAIRVTFFHWGLNGWAIFGIAGLGMAYFGYRRGERLGLGPAVARLTGRSSPRLARVLDSIAVIATVFGITTTLGLGVSQMNTGLATSLDIQAEDWYRYPIIAVVTLLATISVVAGLRRGIRLLSEINIWLSVVLLLLFLVYGPTNHLLQVLIQSTGGYLQDLLSMSTYSGAHDHRWQQRWTVFFWGWWIAWAPFVGMFIARISRGRTIGEYVLGVLLVPCAISFIWIALLGGSALHLQLEGTRDIAAAVDRDLTTALYETIAGLQMPDWIGWGGAAIATLLIAIYYVTSADSGTLVVTTLLSRDGGRPPRVVRAAWAIAIGGLTAALLLAGGVQALQTTVILAALPFSLVLLALVASLIRCLGDERRSSKRGRRHERPRDPYSQEEEAHPRGDRSDQVDADPDSDTGQERDPALAGDR